MPSIELSLSAVADSSDRATLASVAASGDGLSIPALNRDYKITIHAYVYGSGSGDKSTAFLKLFQNGNQVAYRADASFDSYDLDILHTVILARGTAAAFQSEHNNNHGATELGYGIEISNVDAI